jgi:uncharacterized membrane protein YbaN (DUF454 family)
MKKVLWYSLGMLSLGMAYIGLVVPGIPFSIFLVFAAFCFAKSSKKMHDWLYNHKWFGKFLTDWTNHRVFPLKAKYAMVAVMASSLVIMWLTTGNIKAILWAGITMLAVAIWTWRYPSSVDQVKNKE